MTHSPRPPHDDPAAREWALQERALWAERLGLDSRDDASVQRYRAITRALRQPLQENLPPDFATQMAAQMHQRQGADMRLELWLSWMLLGVLASILAGLAVLYGRAWLPLALSALPLHQLLNPWLVAPAACLALSGTLGRLMPTQGASSH